MAKTVQGEYLCQTNELCSAKKKIRQPGTYLNHDVEEIPYSDFINKELILFSMADNIRSIPSVADGLKPGQRKVIWGCFKRKLKKEIKVRHITRTFEDTLLIVKS